MDVAKVGDVATTENVQIATNEFIFSWTGVCIIRIINSVSVLVVDACVSVCVCVTLQLQLRIKSGGWKSLKRAKRVND